jgi:hypothetical protein
VRRVPWKSIALRYPKQVGTKVVENIRRLRSYMRVHADRIKVNSLKV